MTDDEKNITDAGKLDDPSPAEKVESDEAALLVQDQPSPVKTEVSVVEVSLEVTTPPGADKFTKGTIFESQRLNNKNTAEENPLRYLVRVARVELTAS